MKCPKTIDVAIPTLNSAETLRECLESVLASVPVRRLIVVDGGSTDDTVDIAREFGADVVIETGLLGKVTYLQAQLTSGQWFLQISSDVVLHPHWWKTVVQHMLNNVALITVLGENVEGLSPSYYQDFLYYGAILFSGCGGCVWLVRRDVVLSCTRLLENVHAHYDDVLCGHIRELGMEIVLIPERLFRHQDVGTMPSRAFRMGQSVRWEVGLTLKELLVRFLLQVWAAKLWTQYCRENRSGSAWTNMKLFGYLQYLHFWTLLGYAAGGSRSERTATNM